MSDHDARRKILERRARFLALALTGTGLVTSGQACRSDRPAEEPVEPGRCLSPPEPCLSVRPDPETDAEAPPQVCLEAPPPQVCLSPMMQDPPEPSNPPGQFADPPPGKS